MKLNSCMTPLNGESCILQITDPLIGAALISGGSSLLGGFLGNSASSKEGERQRKWASAENALNRQFQHDEAELSYNRNEQTRIAQNEWNSEPAQVSRMRQAGINPYNALSGLSGSSATSAGNTASAGNAHGSSISYQQRNLDWVRAISETGLVAAQAYKTRAEANLINSENKGQDLQNDYDVIRNSIQEQLGEKNAQIDYQLKQAGLDLTKVQEGVQKSIQALNEYDLNNLKPKEKDLLVAKIATEKVMPAYYEALANCSKVQAFCMGQKLGSEILALRAAANRDNASASKSYSDIALNALLGKESVSRRFLNDTLEQESQSRIWLNGVDERMRNLQYKREQRIYDETIDLVIKDTKAELMRSIGQNQRRDPNVVGKGWAAFYNGMDNAKGLFNVGVGFNVSSSRTKSNSYFQGHTTSTSRSSSESVNYNYNYRGN